MSVVIPLGGRTKVPVSVPAEATHVVVKVRERRDTTSFEAHNESGPDPAYVHLEAETTLGVRAHPRLPLVWTNTSSRGAWQFVWLGRPPNHFTSGGGMLFFAGEAVLDAAYVRRVGGFFFTLTGSVSLEWASEIGDTVFDDYGALSTTPYTSCEVVFDIEFR